MSKRIPSKDEALEALDFIVNVLKEHEKDLDRLINELGGVTEKMGETGELNQKMERIEGRLNNLQGDITNLITYLSSHNEPTPASSLPTISTAEKHEPVQVKESPETVREYRETGLTLRCKRWEDFQAAAEYADTMSFMYSEVDGTFQVDAVKGNQIITYSGQIPAYSELLKSWLSRQLNVSEKNTVEGILAVG
jgi:hypothetical protein